ncbi:MAG: hypothetical protein R3312_02170, partial [Gammaproteobacteria bacterium]|nr:hypothetical protein [Gammaproteobacteria bacterium]
MSEKLPRIPIDVFRKMIATLPPDEISKIPPEKLPENIPVDLVDEAPIYSRSALETLILSANSYHLQQRMDLQQRYGDELLEAMDISKTMLNTATLRVFKNKLDDMQKLRKRWHETRNREQRDQLISSIKNMQGQVLDVRAENARLTRALRLLKETKPILQEDAEAIQTSTERLRKGSSYIEQRLAEFFLLRLEALNTEMQQRYKEILSFEEESAILDSEIEGLRAKLERSQSVWKRTFQRDKSNHEMEELQNLISTLVAERQNKEGTISENDLTLWLDTIVDASVHPFTRERVNN